jgi:hypothetical protein
MLTQNMKNSKSIEKLSLSKMLNVTILDSKKANQEAIKEAKRVNLIHLCKNRTLSQADDRDMYMNNSINRSSEERTESSSNHAKNSLTSSPMMTTLEFEDYTILEQPLKTSSIPEEKVALRKQREMEKTVKHTEFYCQASYKISPKKSILPPLNF